MARPKKKAESKRRAAGEGGLFERADGMWCGVVDVPSMDGKRRQKRVYSKDYAKAVQKLRDLKDDIAKGVLPTTNSTTVARWLDYWLNTIHGPHVRPKTRQFYEEAVRLHLTPAIGKHRLDRLTPQHVRAALDGIGTSRNRQRAHQVLNMALKAAVVDGVIGRNVCDAVRKPAHLQAQRTAFTAEQAKQIIRAGIDLDDTRGPDDPALATRWAAAFLSGARKAELLGMEWDRVDLDAGVFEFAWQLQQLRMVHGCGDPPTCERTRPSACPQAKWDFEDDFEYRECHGSLLWTRPKTKAGYRVVPIIPGLLELLRHHRTLTSGEPNPHNLVWHHVDGRPISPKDDHEYWQALLIAAKITTKDKPIPLHAARHSTATLLQGYGVDEETRMQILGQSSVAAHRAYIHVDQTHTRAALSKLAGILE